MSKALHALGSVPGSAQPRAVHVHGSAALATTDLQDGDIVYIEDLEPEMSVLELHASITDVDTHSTPTLTLFFGIGEYDPLDPLLAVSILDEDAFSTAAIAHDDMISTAGLVDMVIPFAKIGSKVKDLVTITEGHVPCLIMVPAASAATAATGTVKAVLKGVL